MSNKTQGQVLLVSVGWAINCFAFSIVFPFLSIYLHEERGIPMATAGLIFPVIGVAHIFGPLISGFLVDRFGYRFVSMAGPLLRGAGFAWLANLVAQGAEFWLLALGVFLVCMVGTFFQNATDAYVTDLTPTDMRADCFSRIRVGLNVGWMIGPAIGAFLAKTPFEVLFSVASICCFGTAVVALYLRSREVWEARAAEEDIKTKESIVTGFFNDKKFLVFSLLAFPIFMMIAQLISTFSVYTTSVVGISKNGLGFLYTINGLIIILVQIPLNKKLGGGRLGYRLAVGAILYAIGYFSIGFGHVWTHLMISVIIFTIGEILAEPALSAGISNIAPKEKLGRYLGAFGMLRGIGFSVGPYFGALLFDAYKNNPVMLWGMIGLVSALSGIGFIFIRNMKELK